MNVFLIHPATKAKAHENEITSNGREDVENWLGDFTKTLENPHPPKKKFSKDHSRTKNETEKGDKK